MKEFTSINSLEEIIENISKQMEDLKTQLICALSADNANLFTTDIFMMGAVNRSLALSAGFIDLIKKSNYLCAAALVRMHLETTLKIYALCKSSDPHGDAEIYLKVGSNPKYNYTNLATQLSTEELDGQKLFSNALTLYKETCEFVHLTWRHIYSTCGAMASFKNGKFDVLISPTMDYMDSRYFIGLSCKFSECTDITLFYIRSWGYTKQKYSGISSTIA